MYALKLVSAALFFSTAGYFFYHYLALRPGSGRAAGFFRRLSARRLGGLWTTSGQPAEKAGSPLPRRQQRGQPGRLRFEGFGTQAQQVVAGTGFAVEVGSGLLLAAQQPGAGALVGLGQQGG